MARFHRCITEELRTFMEAQKVFFTATAGKNGRINVSPKGLDTFRYLDAHTVAYLDLTGSGNETEAHLIHNGRLTIMFCSFDEKPLIVRMYGTATNVGLGDDRWQELVGRSPQLPGASQIILMQVDSLQTSCGFGVPVYDFTQERDSLTEWAAKKGEPGLAEYRRKHNAESIDGLPTGLVHK